MSDPTYLPLQGQIFGQSSYDYERTNGNIFDTTGAQTATTRNTTNTFRQGFAYGITDALSVNASMAYAFGDDRRVNLITGHAESNHSGFEDPSFGATYRLLDQRTHPLSFDIFGDWSPDALQSRNATSTQDATVARGGSQADVGFALGRETRFFTIRGDFAARYFGGSSTLNPAIGGSVDTSSYWVPSLGVQTQTRFTDRLSANVGYNYDFQGSPTVFNTANNLEHTDKIGDTQNMNVALNYHIIPNKLVGSVGYQHTFYDGRNEIFPTDPADDTLQTRSSDSVNATLRYVFK